MITLNTTPIIWLDILTTSINFKVLTKVLPTKGNLAWEYNPLRNYRLQNPMYEFKNSLYSLGDLVSNFGITPNISLDYYIDNNITYYQISGSNSTFGIGKTMHTAVANSDKLKEIIKLAYVKGFSQNRTNLENALRKVKFDDYESNNAKLWNGVPNNVQDPVLREKGELVDFITDELNFQLDHPVSIIPQYSYDGSVNLILNDGINAPKLINTRFSATGKDTYEIVDRKGNNDTNIYDLGNQFDVDTSLYKKIVKIPKLKFKDTTAGGNLKIGNYVFYFKYSDADGNETDFVAESGNVHIFIGHSFPDSALTGERDENSYKGVLFVLSNIDSSYDYVTVYYSRTTSEDDKQPTTEYHKINKKYLVNNSDICNIIINGFEEITPIKRSDINLLYNIVDSAKSLATCSNMLFLANVHKPEIPYDELADLSLRFLPYLKLETYALDMDHEYSILGSSLGYYDPKYIYYKTGYWGLEIYRLGIVYIMPNNELSPVFNIRGGNLITPCASSNRYAGIGADAQFTEFPVWKGNKEDGTRERNYINYDENTYYTIAPNDTISKAINCENVKGVVRFTPTQDTNIIYGIDIRVDDDTILELKKYVKGYFFVRQTRIPTILAQGVTMGIDQESKLPCIATADGFLNLLSNTLSKTHVETADINDVNYISEGFLSRYKFHFEDLHSGLFSRIFKAIALGLAIVAAAVVCVYTCGLAAPALAVAAGTLGTIAAVGGAAVGATALAIAAAGVIQETRYALGRAFAVKKLEGRNTKTPSGYDKEEDDDSRLITHDFLDRIIIKDHDRVKVLGILCPEFEVNQAYFNSIFTGNEHAIELTNTQCVNGKAGHSSNYFTNDLRHFYIPEYYDMNCRNKYTFKIVAVPDDTLLVGIDKLKFRSRAGLPEESAKFEQICTERKNEEREINTDIVRGSFGPYLAFNDSSNKFSPAETVNIYIPQYNVGNMLEYFQIRMQDVSPFYAISERMAIEEIDSQLIVPVTQLIGDQNRTCGYKWELFRGDCFICQYTHRLNRNFSDPSAPYNHEIVDPKTWKDNFKVDESEKFENINIGDVNAVRLGMWVTFRVRSSMNLNIRTKDSSNIDEVAMIGHARGSYPNTPMSTEGTYKHPDSFFYNQGFKKSVGDRDNKEIADVPYIKNWFGTRIMYSDISINDAYKNGFRTFRGDAYKDYTREYGEITKIISTGSDGAAGLFVIFEHGIGFVAVNEKIIAANAQSGHVHLSVDSVLGDMKVLNDAFGSQWPDSVIKIPMGAGMTESCIMGVDTVAKKIWMATAGSVKCISDFKVLKFLNDNISLGEREKDPLMGIRNVKTVYNAFKLDVMFTFYDNLNSFEEKVWNLCYNMLMGNFTTFYSWVPSYMENINNIPFSFNRDTSKWIAKLGTSHANNSFANGITLSENIIENHILDSNGKISKDIYIGTKKIPFTYLDKNGQTKIYEHTEALNHDNLIGYLNLENKLVPEGEGIDHKFDFALEHDTFGNYKKFKIEKIREVSMPNDAMYDITKPLYGLFFNLKYSEVLYDTDEATTGIQSGNVYEDATMQNQVYVGSPGEYYNVTDLYSELYYRNTAGNCYSDWENHSNKSTWDSNAKIDNAAGSSRKLTQLLTTINEEYPIYKNRRGQRIVIPRDYQLNPTNIVTLLNIRCDISTYFGISGNKSLSEAYLNYIKSLDSSGSSTYESDWISAGSYQSVVAVIPRWNMQFLSTDFWKHGKAGLIDIADSIFPTYWYGLQHPFEFEFVVVNDPGIHKIFTNLEIIANKAKPESFHFEIIGEAYLFAKDKKNMYFRLEARKALLLYCGLDITYNSNFLEVEPSQNAVSAELIHKYYERLDTINEIYDSYIGDAKRTNDELKSYAYESWLQSTSPSKDYSHLSGAEIVYYPDRQEFRIWLHQPAVNIDELSQDTEESIAKANCRYLEDRWKVLITPLLITYRNEYSGGYYNDSTSYWAYANDGETDPLLKKRLPPITLANTAIPSYVWENLNRQGFPNEAEGIGKENALYGLYDWGDNWSSANKALWKAPYSTSNWLDEDDENGNDYYGFGEAHNREEADLRDRFMKVRIRYSGEELAIIEMINTMYQISYA